MTEIRSCVQKIKQELHYLYLCSFCFGKFLLNLFRFNVWWLFKKNINTFTTNKLVYITVRNIFNKDLYPSMKLLLIFIVHVNSLLSIRHFLVIRPDIQSGGAKVHWKTMLEVPKINISWNCRQSYEEEIYYESYFVLS